MTSMSEEKKLAFMIAENNKLRHSISILKSELLKHISFNELKKLLKDEDSNMTVPENPSGISTLETSSDNVILATKNTATENNINSNNSVVSNKSEDISRNFETENKPNEMVSKKLSGSSSTFGLSKFLKNTQQISITPEISIVPPRSSNRQNSIGKPATKDLLTPFELDESDASLIEATIEDDDDGIVKGIKEDEEEEDIEEEEEEDFSLLSITNKNTKRSVKMKGIEKKTLITPTEEIRSIKSPRLLDSEIIENSALHYNLSSPENKITANNLNISSQILDIPDLNPDFALSSSLIQESDRLVNNDSKTKLKYSDKRINPPKSPVPAKNDYVDELSSRNDRRESAYSVNTLSSSIQLSPSASILATPKLSPSPQLLKSLSPVLKHNSSNNQPATSIAYKTSRIQIKQQSSNGDMSSIERNKKSQQTPTDIKFLDEMNDKDAKSQRSSFYNNQLSTQQSPINQIQSPRSQMLQSPRSVSKNRHNVIYDNKLHSPMRMEPLDISEIEEELKSFNDMEKLDLTFDIQNDHPVEKFKLESTSFTQQKNESLFVQPNDLKTVEINLISCIYFLEDIREIGFLFEVVDRGSGKKLYNFTKKYEQVLRLLLQFQKFTDMSMDIPSFQSDEDNCIPLKIITRHINVENIFKHALNFSVDSENISLLMKLSEFISTNINIKIFEKSNFLFSRAFSEELIRLESYCLIKRYKTLGTSSSWKCRCAALVEINNNNYLKFMDLSQDVVESMKLSSNTILEFYDNNEQDLEKYGCYNGFYISENGKKSGISSSKNNNKFYVSFETKKIRDQWIKRVYEIVNSLNLTTTTKQQQTYSDVLSIKSDESLESSANISMTKNELKRHRMRSLFPFKQKELNYNAGNLNSSSENLSQRQSVDNSDFQFEDYSDNGGVFGNPLHFALLKSQKTYNLQQIPSVVYSCLQKLYSNKENLCEEGIFRISGSSLAIKNLIETFDREYDVSLKDSDIHVVTGLLKTFLRLLPDGGGILGLVKESSVDKFREVIDLNLSVLSVLQKFKALLWTREVVDQDHFSLCFVIFELLWRIVEKNSYNKMTLKNVVIVFAPTLDLPVEILTHFIRDFNALFKKEVPIDPDMNREALQLNIPGM
ncbi:hypothetical protein QEN19_002054 [Hanseniaspora menglaensis]